LSPDDVEVLTATHFLRNAPDGTDNTEGNETTRVIERYAVLEAQLQTTMSAMFGMTIDCARCHNHKFDPIPQRDYYALQAIFYPAFNVKSWVQPKDRWIFAAGQAEIAARKTANEQADREVAALTEEHRDWLVKNRPAGRVLWRDDFTDGSLAHNWRPHAPGDNPSKATPLAKLDSQEAPAAKVNAERMSVFAGPSGDSVWVATERNFDWTPEQIGHWIQVTFDLVESRGANGQPAERVGYYLALHDHDDTGPVKGGNILLDGNPAGGASVVLDYPGSDQHGLGTIGTGGYLAGHNFGVRITRLTDKDLLLQHVVDGICESKSLKLTAEQLPDGAFGFELCCSRNFTVDNVVVESSTSVPDGEDKNEFAKIQAEFAKRLDDRNQQLTAALATANSKRVPEPEKIAWVTDLSEKPPEVPLLKRGDYFRPGDVVQPGPLSILNEPGNVYQLEPQTPGSKTTGRRLAFARWATRPQSRAAALLARVQVDRLWRGHFKQGLVPTPENFGVSGVRPTHPELLEWLATQLIENGWHQKAIHREIVLSRTYGQESVGSAAALEKDPTNTAYSRFPAHRLEAEQVRDGMLAVAGVLNPKRGGPAIETVDNGNRQIVLPTPTGTGPHEVDRRSIYIRYRRSTPLSFLRVFDQASPEPNCVARGSSTVVAQSLAMLNGDFANRMGQELASRIFHEMPEVPIDLQVQHAFKIALAREPTEPELAQCREFVRVRMDRRNTDGPEKARLMAMADLCRMLLATNEFLFLQ
jgi:hypothetical protein